MAADEQPTATTKRTVHPHDLVVNKASWLPGPWRDEPDRVQFRTAAGLPGLVVRGPHGALCGYAGVPNGHPLYGCNYNAPDVSVHGGLTYADRCMEDGPVCHVPEPGEPDDVWWFGFDCAHAWDFCPGSESRLPAHLRAEAFGIEPGTYRDVAYVRDQVEQLAGQLAEMNHV